MPPRRAPLHLALLGATALAGCSSPVAVGLDDAEATRAVVALREASVEARKEAEAASDGRFRVVVADSDASRALAALADEGLPRPRPASLAAVGKGALVPSLAAEQASLAAGLSGELERTLGQVDGVVFARVHLTLPTPSPLRDRRERATASVLVSYRSATPPLSEAQIRKIVAGAAPELSPDDVAVVAVTRPAPTRRNPELARVGPIAVAPGSATPLRALLGVLVALVGALAAATLALYVRLSRARGASA